MSEYEYRYRYESYCGLYCGACDILRAGEEGRLKDLAKRMGRSEKDFACRGCKSSLIGDYALDCDIRKCVMAKGFEFCGECGYFPCRIIRDFSKDNHIHHRVVIRNMEYIMKNGIQKWLEEQAKRWTCLCGSRFAWYDDDCFCGNKLFNCIKEGESYAEN